MASTNSPKPKVYRCRTLNTPVPVSARQDVIAGWDQDRYAQCVVGVAGGGGLGGEIGEGLTRKGIGAIHLCDAGTVTPPCLNRQKFVKRSLYCKKAGELCRLLAKQGFLGTKLYAYDCWFQDLDPTEITADVWAIAVDNRNPQTRLDACRALVELAIPAVFTAVSTDADRGYVFVQKPGQACWACAFKPDFEDPCSDAGAVCPGVPAVGDILKAVCGHALYAIDSLLLPRPRDWNYRVLSLSSDFGGSQRVARRRDCPVCGVANEVSEGVA